MVDLCCQLFILLSVLSTVKTQIKAYMQLFSERTNQYRYKQQFNRVILFNQK